jgi:PAS domain S-box-containing protein
MRKQTDDMIIAAEKNLRLLINHSDDPIWLVGPSYSIVECNLAFKTWVKYFIGRELDKGDHVLFEGKDKSYQAKFEMCYKNAFAGSSFRSVEDMVIDDETRYTAVSFNPVYNEAGEIMAVSCFARDITEQRHQLNKIEAQNNALRDIAFMESHRLRRPLANIIGLQDLFNYDDPADPMNRELLEGIAQMSHELDHIVHEVVRKTNDVK